MADHSAQCARISISGLNEPIFTPGACARFVPCEMPNGSKQFKMIQTNTKMEIVDFQGVLQ